MTRTRAAWRLLRPRQWAKGLLVFAALLFARGYLDPTLILRAFVAFVAMGLVSSATYVVNDLIDRDRDRNHPTKRERPLASGAISPTGGVALMVGCLLGGVALAAWLGLPSLGVLAAYLLLQGAYNMGLKHQPVADVFTLSLGFVLRAALGAAAIGVAISGWLLFCTGSLALLLAFGKRRHEFIVQGERRAHSREALAGYTRETIDGMLLMAGATAAMSYGIYSIESATARQYPALIGTSLFVFYGVYRYVYLLLAKQEGGEPEYLLFRDPHILISVVLFVATALLALSGFSIPFVERVK